MHLMILGAGGMIGRKLTQRLLSEPGALAGEVKQLTLVDVFAPELPPAAGPKTAAEAADLSVPGTAERLVARRPDVIFHLAAIVSGEAEANFEKGYAVNLDGTRALFEAIRLEGKKSPYRPRVIFASSIAVFGQPYPEAITDEFLTAPLTSYGTQKAICELLLSDYSRRGFFDGIGIRLPTVCIRPGKPNQAASGFFSNILREPLVGKEAVLPVAVEVRHWFCSPRSAVGFLVAAAKLDLQRLGARRNLAMPGLSATVAEEIEALRSVAGDAAVRLIRHEPNPTIIRMVAGWAERIEAKRAIALGFQADTSFTAIVWAHIDDELGGKIGG